MKAWYIATSVSNDETESYYIAIRSQAYLIAYSTQPIRFINVLSIKF
jgi:hypothetical protein